MGIIPMGIEYRNENVFDKRTLEVRVFKNFQSTYTLCHIAISSYLLPFQSYCLI